METRAPLESVLARMAGETSGLPDHRFEVQRLRGDASSRIYYRLRAAETSLVAMVLPAGKTSEELGTSKASEELPFLNIQRYLALTGTPVPAVHRTDLKAGILLLEDLGDTTLEAALPSGNPTPGAKDDRRCEELYGTAIDLLAEMRMRAEAHPDPTCLAFGRSFDRQLYRWEFEHYLEYGWTARTGQPPSAAEAEVLGAAFDRISEELAALPRGFTHRDYQSRNLMLAPRGMVVIDFQDALLGPRQYDLVALLRDSYVQLADGFVDRLLTRYLERLQQRFPSPKADPEVFREDFDLLTVQRKLKDAGRFEFIDRVKGNPSFLPYVGRSLAYVGRALERLPRYGELLRVLRGRHPEMSAVRSP